MPKGPAPASDAPRKKIFIVDDHPVFRQGLEQLVDGEGYLAVCGSAGTVAQAITYIPRLKPDLVLVDISLPDRTGLDLIRHIRKEDRRLKLLVVSMHDEALYANRVLRAGGDGYIMKQEDPGEVVHAIRDVLNGHIYVSEQVLASKESAGAAPVKTVRQQNRPLAELTDPELEVLEALGHGKTNSEVARRAGMTTAQVKSSCAAIQKKLKLPSYNALIRYAVRWTEAES